MGDKSIKGKSKILLKTNVVPELNFDVTDKNGVKTIEIKKKKHRGLPKATGIKKIKGGQLSPWDKSK